MNTTRAEKKAARIASNARIAAAQAEARTALAENRCPCCGQGVRTNSSLTGWVQCDGYGAEGFRKAGSTHCAWQGFTQ
jgi:hypothetical protein